MSACLPFPADISNYLPLSSSSDARPLAEREVAKLLYRSFNDQFLLVKEAFVGGIEARNQEAREVRDWKNRDSVIRERANGLRERPIAVSGETGGYPHVYCFVSSGTLNSRFMVKVGQSRQQNRYYEGVSRIWKRLFRIETNCPEHLEFLFLRNFEEQMYGQKKLFGRSRKHGRRRNNLEANKGEWFHLLHFMTLEELKSRCIQAVTEIERDLQRQ